VRTEKKPQISPLRYPDFLLVLVALVNFMRLSLLKAAHVALSCAAWQEIRVRSGRDDNSVEPITAVCPLGTQSFLTQPQPKAGKMPAPQSAIAQRSEDLERFEFMMGAERGRLAVTLDMLTDALILIGQHGVYCASTRNPAKPALDLEAVLAEIGGAKELIQSVMEQLRLKSENAAER
jgi:hypothetical protein